MRNISLLIVLALLVSWQAMAQTGQEFILDGKLSGQKDGKIYMRYQSDEMKYTIDSVLIKDGRFSFRGRIPHPVAASLYLNRNAMRRGAGDMAEFFIEPRKMTVTLSKGNFKAGTLSGSKTEEENRLLKTATAAVEAKLAPLNKVYDENDLAYRDAGKAKKDSATLAAMLEKLYGIRTQMEPYYEERSAITKQFIEEHPDSYVSAYLLGFYLNDMKLEQGERAYNRMPAALQQSMYGKIIWKELEGLRGGSPGSPAHVFTKKDINGEMLNLSDYKGKYVLLDFWASWCRPCRKGNPHLKSLYTKYKDKGLEIIGISDDDSNLAAWKKAVDQDGIGIWKHVLRGLDMQKKMKNEPNPEDLSDYYGIHSLPTKILIDPSGMIIGRYGYGGGGEDDDAMDKKLEAVFK